MAISGAPRVGEISGTPRVVAIGGGTGLAVSLSAIRSVTTDLTAVVSVADDGGSTGRLRTELDLPALGDLRKAILALADHDSIWVDVMRHRFPAGDLQDHSFGNLLIAALLGSGCDLVEAVDRALELVAGVGRVLPNTEDPVTLCGWTGAGVIVTGQVEIMETAGVERVWLDPDTAGTPKDVLLAIEEATHIVLGPGSLFTSLLAATAVPSITDAIGATTAEFVYVANLRPQVPETGEFTLEDHLRALTAHGLQPDRVLVDSRHMSSDPNSPLAGELAGTMVVEDVALAAENGFSHDPVLLARALFGDSPG